jgi:predicted dehydrogenase
MADGSFATLSVTLGCEEEITRLRFCFEGLTAESNHSPYNPGTAPWRFVAADPERQAQIDAAVAEVPPGPERNAGQFLRLHKALVEGGPLPVTIEDARRALELLTAAYHSARTGTVVHLPLGRDHPLFDGWISTATKEAV